MQTDYIRTYFELQRAIKNRDCYGSLCFAYLTEDATRLVLILGGAVLQYRIMRAILEPRSVRTAYHSL